MLLSKYFKYQPANKNIFALVLHVLLSFPPISVAVDSTIKLKVSYTLSPKRPLIVLTC